MRDFFGCSGEGSDSRCSSLVIRQRLLILFLLVAGISLLHYLTSTLHHPSHDIYRRLYYIPIVLGGLWFCLGGGILTALVVSFAYLPHILLHWQHLPQGPIEQYLELVLYNVIGFLTGFLSWREHRQTLLAQQVAQQLEASYETLRQQADQIFDIENKLRRSERLSAIGELTAGLAHEIRNPLGSIRGAAEVVVEGIDAKDRRAEFGQILLKEVDRLNKVVMDFLLFAKPETSVSETVPLGTILDHVHALLKPPAEDVGAQVEVHCDKTLRDTSFRDQLQQVLLNLGLNAIQAMPEGGRLTIHAQRRDDFLVVTLQDTGIGIAKDLLDRVFNPFFTTRKDGTGLGLAICARIIQGLGGELSLDSQQGEGTLASVSIPFKQKEGEHARAVHPDY